MLGGRRAQPGVVSPHGVIRSIQPLSCDFIWGSEVGVCSPAVGTAGWASMEGDPGVRLLEASQED